MKERSSQEVWGNRATKTGIVVALLGLIAAPELAFPGVLLAAAGEIFSSSSEKSKQA